MTQPSASVLEDIKNRIIERGYLSYTISKKESQIKQFSQKKYPPNPYFVVKNTVSNRVFQIKWAGDDQEFFDEILSKIEEYETIKSM